MQEITWKLYSPLRASYFPPDYENDLDNVTELDGENLTEYADQIRDAVKQFNAGRADLVCQLDRTKMAQLADKVVSIVPSVQVVDAELMGCAIVRLREPLHSAEANKLRAFLSDQYYEGWGNEFDWCPIKVTDGELRVHFWNGVNFGIDIDRHPHIELAPQQGQPKRAKKRGDDAR